MVLLAPHDSAGHWSYKFEAVAVPYLRLSAFICGSIAVRLRFDLEVRQVPPAIALLGAFIMTAAALPAPVEFVVSPDSEIQSLQAARDLARAHHKNHPDETVAITLRGGYYVLAEPLILGPEDSNTIIQGAPGETAILGSARAITGWEKLADNLWAAPAPGTKEGSWDFRTLVVNGRWRRRAYLPKEGFFHHLSEYKEPWRSTSGGGFGKVAPELKRTMIYKPEDLGPWLSEANAELIIYHSWDMSHARIAKHDVENHTLHLKPLLGYPAGAFGVKRYTIQNVKEGMHKPGMWYLDRENGRVVYWPLPDEDMTKAEVIAPVGSGLIRIEGSAEQPVRNLTIRNLTLADTNVPWKSPGFGAAGIKETAAQVSWAQDCLLENVHFRNLGGNALIIWAGKGNRITNCHIDHTGAGGIVAHGGKEFGVGDDLMLTDNHIHHCGLVYPAAIAVRVGNVANALIARNLIHDIGYTGICFSGDLRRPRAINAIIESNHICRCMTALNDGGGIYLSGQIDGAIVRSNLIHDIHGLTGMGWGIYPDEQSRDVLVTGNLVYRCLGSFHCHMTHDIIAENNIFAFADKYQVALPRSKDITLRRNVFVTDEEPIFGTHIANPREHVRASDQNLFFSTSADRPKFGKTTWDDWLGASFDASSVFADPLFADVTGDDFTLSDNSPALALGFTALDLTQVPEHDPEVHRH